MKPRVWPLSPSLNRDISVGFGHWLADQFYWNWRMLWLIRRSKRIDRLIDASEAGSRSKLERIGKP